MITLVPIIADLLPIFPFDILTVSLSRGTSSLVCSTLRSPLVSFTPLTLFNYIYYQWWYYLCIIVVLTARVYYSGIISILVLSLRVGLSVRVYDDLLEGITLSDLLD